jgi:hypothetical protein
MEPDKPAEYVIATYEEIRQRFGLGGTDQTRIKAKRRKWEHEPPNHPGAVARVRVPREAWDAAPAERDRSREIAFDRFPGIAPDQSRTFKALEGAVTALREERDRLLRERDGERTERMAAQAEASALRAERDAAHAEAATREEEVERLTLERDMERSRLEEERARAAAEAKALAADREEARIRAARLEGELEALRRPFWRRWLG